MRARRKSQACTAGLNRRPLRKRFAFVASERRRGSVLFHAVVFFHAVFHHAILLHAVLLHAVVFLHRVLGHRFLLHAVVLAHLVLSEGGGREGKAERNEGGRNAEADTGRGGHGMVLWVGFSKATSAASLNDDAG